MIEKNEPYVSIVTPTYREDSLYTIIANYERQNYKNKELIILINNNKNINIDKWYEKIKQYKNIKIFDLKDNISLGECRNIGVEKATFDYIAYFDDDDYYSENFLKHSMDVFNNKTIDIVGKTSAFIYFEKTNTLALYMPNQENTYSYDIRGATMIVKRSVFDKVKFKPITQGEDTMFLYDCFLNDILVFSCDKYNFLIYRNKRKSNHTWKADDEFVLKSSKTVTITNDYISYITK